MVLGELRADLLTITPNAEADLVEINNFNISKNNKYASPTNFFKLISASNNLLRILKSKHPEVLDKKSAVTNYDRLAGKRSACGPGPILMQLVFMAGCRTSVNHLLQ